MTTAIAILEMNDLPADATNAQAMAWVGRMRRTMERWESLPCQPPGTLTTEMRADIHRQLDAMERSVEQNMQIGAGT